MGDRKKSPSSPSPLLPGTLRFKALWFQLRELGRSVLGRRVSRRRAHLPPDAVAQAAPLRDGSGGEHRPLRPLRGHPHRSGTGTPAAPLHAGPSSASRGWGEGTSAGGRAGRLLPAPGINRGGGIGSGACSAPRPRLGSQPPAAAVGTAAPAPLDSSGGSAAAPGGGSTARGGRGVRRGEGRLLS